jgi:hypothetical protein
MEAGARWEMAERARERALWWARMAWEASSDRERKARWQEDLEMYLGMADLGADAKEREAGRSMLESCGALCSEGALLEERFADRAVAAFAKFALARRTGAVPSELDDASWRDAALHIKMAAEKGVRRAEGALGFFKEVLESLGSRMELGAGSGDSGREWLRIFAAYGAKRQGMHGDVGPALDRVADKLDSLAASYGPDQFPRMSKEIREGRAAMFAKMEAMALSDMGSESGTTGAEPGRRQRRSL